MTPSAIDHLARAREPRSDPVKNGGVLAPPELIAVLSTRRYLGIAAEPRSIIVVGSNGIAEARFMSGEAEYVKKIRAGLEVPGTKVLERRTLGLARIRRQLIAMLTRHTAYRGESSLAFRWRGVAAVANFRSLTDAAFELVMHEGSREIKGRFPDLWVLCYPEDGEIKEKVEAELANMCQQFSSR